MHRYVFSNRDQLHRNYDELVAIAVGLRNSHRRQRLIITLGNTHFSEPLNETNGDQGKYAEVG